MRIRIETLGRIIYTTLTVFMHKMRKYDSTFSKLRRHAKDNRKHASIHARIHTRISIKLQFHENRRPIITFGHSTAIK